MGHLQKPTAGSYVYINPSQFNQYLSSTLGQSMQIDNLMINYLFMVDGS
jgi:hypothetical protein